MMLTLVGAETTPRAHDHDQDSAQVWSVAATLGSWAPPLRTVGSLGSRPFSFDAVHAGSRVLPLVAVRPHSLRDASPGTESSPSRLVGFRVAALALSPPL